MSAPRMVTRALLTSVRTVALDLSAFQWARRARSA